MRKKLAAVAMFAALVAFFTVFDRFVIHLLGIDTQQSDNYDFVSGVGPMLEAALFQSTIIVGLWHTVNCHTDGCLRIGRHHIAGQQYKVCRRCHDKITGHPRRGLTIEHFRHLHQAHQAVRG